MGKLLALLFGNPLYLLAVAVALYAAGAVSGWTVNGWRLGAEIATLEGNVKTLKGANVVLTDANATCKAHVADVKESLKKFYAAQDELARLVKAAMDKATGQAAKHLARADEILARAAVPPSEWCATITKEQADAVQLRREERLKSMKGG